MSFDPYGYNPESPAPAPSSGATGSAPSTTAPTPTRSALERVKLPGMFLIAVGVLNLLGGGIVGLMTIPIAMTPAETLAEQSRMGTEMAGKLLGGLASPEELKKAKEIADNKPPAQVKQEALIQYGGMTAVALAVGLFLIFGGIRMLQLRSYGLCVAASITAAIPCISVSGCCGMGEIVAVWSIIVLMSPEVRMAFR